MNPLDDRLAVFVTLHKPYEKFLEACLKSIVSQSRTPNEFWVLSGPDKAGYALAMKYGAKHFSASDDMVSVKTREGVALTDAPYICFVDADDTLGADYFKNALPLFSDSRVALAYPDTVRECDENDFPVPPQRMGQYSRATILRGNYIVKTSIIRRDAFLESEGFLEKQPLDDWTCWIDLTGLGWIAKDFNGLLNYRRHGTNSSIVHRHRRFEAYDYIISRYPTTIFTAFSGRWHCLGRYFQYLERLKWDRTRLQLVLYDNSCDAEFGQALRLWLQEGHYPNFSYIRDDVPVSTDMKPQQIGDGKASVRTKYAVSIGYKLAHIYNQMKKLATGDFVWIIEDDVIPPDDALYSLMRLQMLDYEPGWAWGDLAGTSGLVMSRFTNEPIALDILNSQMASKRHEPINGPQKVDITSLGCLLMKREALDKIQFRPYVDGTDKRGWYDWAFFWDLKQLGYKIGLDWRVVCKHYNEDGSFV